MSISISNFLQQISLYRMVSIFHQEIKKGIYFIFLVHDSRERTEKMKTKRRIEYLFCIIVIWSVVLIQGCALLHESGEEKSLEVFQTLQLASMEGSVDIYAPFNKLYLNQEEKENVLRQLAEELGMKQGYEVKDDSKDQIERMVLSWKRETEEMNLSITTINVPMEDGNYRQEQYIYMTCEVKEDVEKLLSYKTLMEKMMKRRGFVPSANLNFKGSKSGEMPLQERQEVTNFLFRSLEAREVDSVKEEELYTVYGYSDLLKDSVAYGENEINLNLAFTFDEQKRETVFYLSMPYIRTDY